MALKKHNPGCGCCDIDFCCDCCTDGLPDTLDVTFPAGAFSDNTCTCDADINGETFTLTRNGTNCTSILGSFLGCDLDDNTEAACSYTYVSASGACGSLRISAGFIKSGNQCRVAVLLRYTNFGVDENYSWSTALASPVSCSGNTWTVPYEEKCGTGIACTYNGDDITVEAP